MAGSVDFLTASNHRRHPRGRANREKRNKRKAGGIMDQSKPNQSEISVRRTQSAFETETKTSLLASKIEVAPQDESEDEGHRGSQSPLLGKIL